MNVANRGVPGHPSDWREIQAHIPAVESAVVEGHRKDDSRILELGLIRHEADAPLPEIHIEPKPGTYRLLDSDVVDVLPCRRNQDETLSQIP